jgi:hypothetical protein
MATDLKAQRQRLRGLCLAASELVDELDRMYPQTMPDLSATDRELGAHIGTRKLVELLKQLRNEARDDAGPMGRVLGAQ